MDTTQYEVRIVTHLGVFVCTPHAIKLPHTFIYMTELFFQNILLSETSLILPVMGLKKHVKICWQIKVYSVGGFQFLTKLLTNSQQFQILH